MRKTIAALAVAALAAGCNAKKITADEARAAMPRPEAVQLGTPHDTVLQAARPGGPSALTAAAPDGAPDPAFDTTSEYARMTYFTAWSVNGGAFWTLTLVRFITLFPPTSCGDDTCTWGPWEENAAGTSAPVKAWRLVVTKVDEGQFSYVLAAQNLLQPEGFLPIVSGVAFPRDAFTGHGELTISFDNARRLPDPKDDFGVVTFRYDNETAGKVSAEVVGGRSREDGRLVNAAYDFEATAAGGTLQVAFETREGTAQAISLRSRWDATGAGRGDARYHATDGSWAVTYGASECWDGAAGGYALAWDTDPASGAPEACADAFEGAPLYSDLVVP